MSILLNYGFQKYLVKTPENENVPSEKTSIHCATQETKPLMWLIFPRMIHKSKIKKNRFNGHLHLFFVDLKISYSYNIFLFREYYYQMWVWPPIWIIVLIASNSKNCAKLWYKTQSSRMDLNNKSSSRPKAKLVHQSLQKAKLLS